MRMRNIFIKTIFLDMDGVIVDFHRAVEERFGKVSNPLVWDFNYRKDFNMDFEQFWSSCDNEFWENLEFTKEAKAILLALWERDLTKNVCLLSKPVPHAYQGKVDWIRRNMPQFYAKKQFLLGPDKDWCAHPQALLIDDNYDHCKDFRAAGGHAFLFPRPWNICRDLEHVAVLELESYLDQGRIWGPNAINMG